jgi:hypothetical protein
MKPHLQEAFAKDNREVYLRNKATINAKNNRYYQKNREKILAKRKAISAQAFASGSAVTPSLNPPCLVARRLDHGHTRTQETLPENN